MGRAARQQLVTGPALGHGAVRFVNRLVLPVLGVGAAVAIWALTSAVDVKAAFVDLRVLALSFLGGNVAVEVVVKGLMNTGDDLLAPKAKPAPAAKPKGDNDKKSNKGKHGADPAPKPEMDKKGRRQKV